MIELVSLISSNYNRRAIGIRQQPTTIFHRSYTILEFSLDHIPLFPTSPPPFLRLLFFPFSHLSSAAVTGFVVVLVVVVVVGVVRAARIIAAKRSPRFYSRQATRIVNVFGHYSRFC